MDEMMTYKILINAWNHRKYVINVFVKFNRRGREKGSKDKVLNEIQN